MSSSEYDEDQPSICLALLGEAILASISPALLFETLNFNLTEFTFSKQEIISFTVNPAPVPTFIASYDL